MSFFMPTTSMGTFMTLPLPELPHQTLGHGDGGDPRGQ